MLLEDVGDNEEVVHKGGGKGGVPMVKPIKKTLTRLEVNGIIAELNAAHNAQSFSLFGLLSGASYEALSDCVLGIPTIKTLDMPSTSDVHAVYHLLRNLRANRTIDKLTLHNSVSGMQARKQLIKELRHNFFISDLNIVNDSEDGPFVHEDIGWDLAHIKVRNSEIRRYIQNYSTLDQEARTASLEALFKSLSKNDLLIFINAIEKYEWANAEDDQNGAFQSILTRYNEELNRIISLASDIGHELSECLDYPTAMLYDAVNTAKDLRTKSMLYVFVAYKGVRNKIWSYTIGTVAMLGLIGTAIAVVLYAYKIIPYDETIAIAFISAAVIGILLILALSNKNYKLSNMLIILAFGSLTTLFSEKFIAYINENADIGFYNEHFVLPCISGAVIGGIFGIISAYWKGMSMYNSHNSFEHNTDDKKFVKDMLIETGAISKKAFYGNMIMCCVSGAITVCARPYIDKYLISVFIKDPGLANAAQYGVCISIIALFEMAFLLFMQDKSVKER